MPAGAKAWRLTLWCYYSVTERLPQTAVDQDWAYAFGKPGCHAWFRCSAEDFVVEEVLGFDPDGEGNHAFLHIRKRNTNTEWLARRLAELAGVPLNDVGYAGLKDRHAVTSQYFTVHLSGKDEPDWRQLDSPEITVLDVTRHRRKLRRGALRENRFQIILRQLDGECADLESRLQQIAKRGVPNYFGGQRFGHAGGNLERALAMFRGELNERDRHKRSLYLSAARSWLFNMVLSARVERGDWNHPLPGDSLMMNGSSSCFTVRLISSEIEQRVAAGDLHPSGPLWGRGKPSSLAEALELELAALEGEGALRDGLERAGLEQERRALRLPVNRLNWCFIEETALRLEFALPAGAYATSVLRELVQLKDACAPASGPDAR